MGRGGESKQSLQVDKSSYFNAKLVPKKKKKKRTKNQQEIIPNINWSDKYSLNRVNKQHLYIANQ